MEALPAAGLRIGAAAALSRLRATRLGCMVEAPEQKACVHVCQSP